MKPIWAPKRKVWYQHNSDEHLGEKEVNEVKQEINPEELGELKKKDKLKRLQTWKERYEQ